MATVKLSRDLLEAHLVLGPDERLSPVEAMALLHRRGVVFGILVDTVMQLASQVGPLELKVAQGEPPVHGQDAVVEYLFRTSEVSLAPVIDRFGQADYRNLGLIDNVQPGQALARRTPPVPGQSGTSINGLSLAARRPRDVKLVGGGGTVLNADGTVLYAAIAGTPKLSGNTVAVHQTLRLPGNVCLGTGNVVFDGDLEVMGDVEVQMEVNVTGHVMIRGSVIGGRVIAGGHVTVSGKVLQDAEIRCGGRLSVGFAEYVTLQTEQDLRVRENLIHCQVQAIGPITVGGAIVGGSVTSQTQIAATAIGAPRGVPTLVTVDVAARGRAELAELASERQANEEQLKQISHRLRQARAGNAAVTAQTLVDLLGSFHDLSDRNAAIARREAEVQVEVASVRCPIQARCGIHPEVDIRLGEAHMRVTEPYLADTTWEGQPVELLG